MWSRRMVEGTVASLHAAELPLDGRAVWEMRGSEPTLVMGSAQRVGVVDQLSAADRGWQVTRRRSGGGLVALDPAEVIWLDVTIPFGDPLWQDDVGRSFAWMGEAWAETMARFGVAGRVHAGLGDGSAAGRVVCFAGLGPGELTVDGCKLVGLSQRRNRVGARFQCMVHLRWQPDRWWPLVASACPPDVAVEVGERIGSSVIGLADLGSATAALTGPLLVDHFMDVLRGRY